MTAAVTVRGVRRHEYPALAALTVAAYAKLLGEALGGPYLAELADVAARADVGEVLVAVDDTEGLLGGVTFLPGPGPLAFIGSTDEAAIRYLAVAPPAQGRGVGALLVGACVDRARRTGKARLSLHTTAAMTTAHRLYERLGFHREDGRDHQLESGPLLLAYVLELARPGG